MTHDQILEFLSDWQEEDFLLADGLEGAFVGVAYGKLRKPVACYDRQKCIAILMTRDGMTEDEAEEFFQFNVEDAWVGDRTPMFVVTASGGMSS